MTRSNAVEVSFYDFHPQPANFFQEVAEGLSQRVKIIPPKFFYDERGSKLFEKICELPEYYLTRTEEHILRSHADEITALLGDDCVLVEPGSGSSAKVRILLESLRPRAYLPLDISREHLKQAAESLSAEYPWLDVHAACADFTEELDLPYSLGNAEHIAFFPGSSIGNFEPREAVGFLDNIGRMVGPGGGLLIGVDLKKAPAVLHAAYNDSQHVTASFNLNLLTRVNRELNADFEISQFQHYAFYNPQHGRVEMHLVSLRDQRVVVDGEIFRFLQGEPIHTENSYKYTVEQFQSIAEAAGFDPVTVWQDKASLFSVHFLRRRGNVNRP